MAKKHFDAYLAEVEANYLEMLESLHEVEEEATKGLMSPDRVDQMKNLVQPLKNNYLTLEYVAYLLNMPQRKEKKKAYERRMEKVFKETKSRDKEAIISENKDCIESVKNIMK